MEGSPHPVDHSWERPRGRRLKGALRQGVVSLGVGEESFYFVCEAERIIRPKDEAILAWKDGLYLGAVQTGAVTHGDGKTIAKGVQQAQAGIRWIAKQE